MYCPDGHPTGSDPAAQFCARCGSRLQAEAPLEDPTTPLDAPETGHPAVGITRLGIAYVIGGTLAFGVLLWLALAMGQPGRPSVYGSQSVAALPTAVQTLFTGSDPANPYGHSLGWTVEAATNQSAWLGGSSYPGEITVQTLASGDWVVTWTLPDKSRPSQRVFTDGSHRLTTLVYRVSANGNDWQGENANARLSLGQ